MNGLKLIDNYTLDSKDRKDISLNSTNFTIDIQHPSETIKGIQLKKVFIPLVYDTVNSSNNTITTPSVTMPIGHYDIFSFISELNDQTSGSYTWSFTNNSRIKIVEDSATPFTFDGGTATALLGVDTSSTHTGSASYTFEFFPDLSQNFDYLTLHSRELSKRLVHAVSHSDGRLNMLTTVPLKRYGHSSVLSWEPKSEKEGKFTHNQQIKNIDFYVRNKNNNPVIINNQSVAIVFDRYG